MSKLRPILLTTIFALCYASSLAVAEESEPSSTVSNGNATAETKTGADFFSPYPKGFPADPDQPVGSRWLPPGRPFPSIPVDMRDLKIGFRKTNRSEIEADVGGYRTVYGWKGDVSGHDMILHVGIEGNAYFTMRKEGSRFPLQSSDGLFGVYIEAVRNSWFYQLRYTHISAHLSDGVPDINAAIRYSREYILLRVAKQWGWVRPYFALRYLTNTIPEDLNTLGLQAGFYGIAPVELGLFRPYFGVDYRYSGGREGSTTNYGAGLALTSEMGAPLIRFSINYMTGNDLRGQFIDTKVKKWHGGFELDF